MGDDEAPDRDEAGWPELASAMRLRRRELGISQRGLAARAGVSRATVGRLESGRVDAGLSIVLQVLAAAGLRPALRRTADGRLLEPVEAEVAAALDRLDSGGFRRMPAHLTQEVVVGLAPWTFSRRMGWHSTGLLDVRERWVFRRRPAAVCHPAPMEAVPTDQRFYRELAGWWPLLSPVAEYEEEAAYVATLLHSAGIGVRDVLELGSGGGHTAAHLKRHFSLTLVDLSPEMLAVSRELNPQCRHLLGDMRSLRLNERFDAVFVHDAVGYMTTEDDLRALFVTAYEHCRPGGMALFLPDHVRETYAPGSGSGGADDGGRSARYHSWTWDPDPSDDWILTTYAFVLRRDDGAVEVCHETHRTGLFDRATWLTLLCDAGFEASASEEETEDDRPPRTVFIGHRPRT